MGTARQTIEELRQALLAFQERYNATCLIERRQFLTAMVQDHSWEPSEREAA